MPYDQGVFRQRERTIDNIKRIYAVVYSLSFAFVLKEMYDHVKNYIILKPSDITPKIRDAFTHDLVLRLPMILIFVSTVAVFSYQADKFLDLRYTLRPVDDDDALPAFRRIDFAIDAGSLIFTLVPFLFMAYAFTGDLVAQFGIIPFFVSYQLLFGTAIFFLVFANLPHLLRRPAANAAAILTEEERYASLTVNWLWTNGLTLVVLTILYIEMRGTGALCGTASFAPQIAFAIAFAVIATIRNLYDFYATWPFLYMNARDVALNDLVSPMWLYARSSPSKKRLVLAVSSALGLASALWALRCALPDVNPVTC